MKHFCLISLSRVTCLVVALFASSNVNAQSDVTTDITLKLKLKVEGEAAAIKDGVTISCEMEFWVPSGTSSNSIRYGRLQSGIYSEKQEIVLLPTGAVFSPNSPDGTIAADLTFPNVPFREMRALNGAKGFLHWACLATTNLPNGHGALVGFVENDVVFGNAGLGTCFYAKGNVNMDGSTSDVKQECFGR